MLYTSGSSTFVLSEYSSTTPLPSTTCPSITVTLPRATTTIYNTTPTSTSPSLIVDGGFEAGTSLPFQTSASSSDVSAVVAQGGPLSPASGSQYLLITYNVASNGPKQRREIVNQNVYNLTQNFIALAGAQYTISARAEAAATGNSSADCWVQFCAQTCGPQSPLTTTYKTYSFSFVPASSGSTAAMLSFMCSGSAFVGVDNVAAIGGGAANGSQPAVSYITETVTTSIAFPGAVSTQTVTTTALAANNCSGGIATSIITTTLYLPTSYPVYQNVTKDEFITSTIFSTAVATTTAQPGSITLTTTVVTTSISTTTIDETATEISTIYSTAYSVQTQYATQVRSTVIVSSAPGRNYTATYTQPRQTVTLSASTVTYTPPPVTETATLPASTITYTPPPVTETSTLPAQTTVELETQTSTESDTTSIYVTNTATETDYVTTTQAGPTATTTEICNPSPLLGGDFNDLSAWTVTNSPNGGITLQSSGGYPGSFAAATCRSDIFGYDTPTLAQTIKTCPGLTYDFTYSYIWSGDTYDNNNDYLNLFAGYQGSNYNYIGSIRGTNPTDSAGGTDGQWNTLSGSYTATEDTVDILIAFTCTAYSSMTFGFDSFSWTARVD